MWHTNLLWIFISERLELSSPTVHCNYCEWSSSWAMPIVINICIYFLIHYKKKLLWMSKLKWGCNFVPCTWAMLIYVINKILVLLKKRKKKKDMCLQLTLMGLKFLNWFIVIWVNRLSLLLGFSTLRWAISTHLVYTKNLIVFKTQSPISYIKKSIWFRDWNSFTEERRI